MKRLRERRHLTVSQASMTREPVCDNPKYRSANKLEGKRALITGGDSGIGRAVAVAFAKEGADVAIDYATNNRDAIQTKELVESYGRKCVAYKADISNEKQCQDLVQRTVRELKGLDILVNNAGIQYPHKTFEDIKWNEMQKTFQTNIFSMHYLAHAALKYFGNAGAIINTTSVTAYRGSDHLVDYSSSKGAIVAFTRSLALSLADRGIRVNAVAPGPIWTPLIQATFSPQEQKKFGKKTALGRPGQPYEVAPCYVFLASDDSSYMTGQVLHPNGGEVVNA